MTDPIDVAKRNMEAFNTGDWGAFRATSAPDGVEEEIATGRHLRGVDAIVEAAQGWKQAFPNARGSVRHATACGSTVTLEVTWEGTHTGNLATEQGTIPPSGKQVSVPAALVMEVEGDKIKATRHYFDLLGMMTQIGAVPARAS